MNGRNNHFAMGNLYPDAKYMLQYFGSILMKQGVKMYHLHKSELFSPGADI